MSAVEEAPEVGADGEKKLSKKELNKLAQKAKKEAAKAAAVRLLSRGGRV